MTIEGIFLRINKYQRVTFSEKRKRKLNNDKFTIISNNCWGGMIYESYNLEKQTPTVGLFIHSSDYIKFIKDLKKYLNTNLVFINPNDSKYKDNYKNIKKFGTYPIGKLLDIEIHFLHYKSEEEAFEKWNRRLKRIDWDHIIYKFNDQNGFKDDDLVEFLKLPYKNKIFFTCKDFGINNPTIIKIKQNKLLFGNKQINSSHEPFGNSKYIDINNLINKL